MPCLVPNCTMVQCNTTAPGRSCSGCPDRQRRTMAAWARLLYLRWCVCTNWQCCQRSARDYVGFNQQWRSL